MAQGDETAFKLIYEHYKKPFFAVAFKMTHSPDTASEIVQETFIGLWNNRVKVANAENPAAYFTTMLRNRIVHHFRKMAMESQLKKNVAEQLADAVENQADEILVDKENQSIVQSMISKLPPQQQLVYRLSKQDGLSREEIALRLNISPNTVKNHLAAAIGNIRDTVKKRPFLILWSIISGLGNLF